MVVSAAQCFARDWKQAGKITVDASTLKVALGKRFRSLEASGDSAAQIVEVSHDLRILETALEN